MSVYSYVCRQAIVNFWEICHVYICIYVYTCAGGHGATDNLDSNFDPVIHQRCREVAALHPLICVCVYVCVGICICICVYVCRCVEHRDEILKWQRFVL